MADDAPGMKAEKPLLSGEEAKEPRMKVTKVCPSVSMCIECQAKQAVSEECTVARGVCNVRNFFLIVTQLYIFYNYNSFI